MDTMATSIIPSVDVAEAPSAPEVDIRSTADRAADEAMGATEQSAGDRAIAKIVEAADRRFNNTKATRKYLAFPSVFMLTSRRKRRGGTDQPTDRFPS